MKKNRYTEQQIIGFLKEAEARRVTFEYIEVFYNRIRRHATINNQIPADFAKTCMENLD